MRRPVSRKAVILGLWIAWLAPMPFACRKPVSFPESPVPGAAASVNAAGAYDTNADGKADVFTYATPAGRINRIAYDNDADGVPEAAVRLDTIEFRHARHLVLILDGFGYDVVKGFHDAGGLRLFHPPSRVVAPYPTITDPAMQDILGHMPCLAFEPMYYDRKAGRIVGGSGDYIAGRNQPYNALLDYRAEMLWDAIGYVAPWEVFGKEANDCKRLFDRRKTQELLAYFVSSAGLGTRAGKDGQIKCLRRIDQLVNQVVTETRGLTKVTLLADHGHSYTPARQIAFAPHLKKKGWRVTERLRGPRDVAWIRFGLLTYAGFATNSPAKLAADLAELEGVELASCAENEAVVALGPHQQRAMIRRIGGRYGYTPVKGDPLGLAPVLAKLKPDEKGCFGADELLAATIDHVYPAPLQRLWRAHFALVENPPDVIVSLADRFYSGSKGFAGSVSIASTHGGLNRANSVTFIMSTAGALPAVMRSADIPANMHALTAVKFPMGK